MATTTRPFTTPAPTTAAAARQLADTLAEQETSLAKAQRVARNDASFEAAQKAVADASLLDADRALASTVWETAAANPDIGIEGLFAAFMNMRTTSAIRGATLSQAGGVMDQTRPRFNDINVQISHVNNAADSLLRAEFGDALEGVIRARVDHAARSARDKVQTRTQDAGEAAAAGVKA